MVVSGTSPAGAESMPVTALTATGMLQACGDLCVAATTASASVLWEALLHQRPCRCCSSRLLKLLLARCFCAVVSCSRLLNGPTSTRYQVSSFTVPDSTFTA